MKKMQEMANQKYLMEQETCDLDFSDEESMGQPAMKVYSFT